MKDVKLLKRILKKKVKITETFIVMFLIFGNLGHAIEKNINTISSSNIVNEGNIVNQVTIDSSTVSDDSKATGSGISAFKMSSYDTNPLNTKINEIENSGIIEGKTTIKEENSDYFYANGNGIIAYSLGKFIKEFESIIEKVKNNGLIQGDAQVVGEASGEYTSSVSTWGTGSTTGNGNGIGSIAVNESYNRQIIGGENPNSINTNSIIGSIENSGVIKGFNQTIGKNQGLGFGGALGSGNGIVSLSSIYSSNRTLKAESSIGDIKNNGIIEGAVDVQGKAIVPSGHANASLKAEDSGNGISATSSYNGGKVQDLGAESSITNTVGTISNNGVIKGNGKFIGGSSYTFVHRSGNGISLGLDYYGNNLEALSVIGDITNNGLIQGEIEAQGQSPFVYSSGNGISLGVDSNKDKSKYNVENIKNSGVVRGIKNSEVGNYYSSGNGISFGDSSIGGKVKLISNDGIIGGSEVALSISSVDQVENNGILYGKKISYSSVAAATKNAGIEIGLSTDGSGSIVSIKNGEMESLNNKKVINGQRYTEDGAETEIETDARDSYIISTGNYENSIINGAGVNKGALVVEATTSINDSIVNGYNTAIYLEDSSQLISSNTILNGGGLHGDSPVLKGSTGDNVASISGTSIINGSVDLENGNDKLTISNSVQINGDLNGGLGKDILNLGESSIAKASSNLNILHDIKGFESINTNGNITLFETAKITDAADINLESGNLVLRVNPTVTENGKIIGHALYENNGTLTSTGGNLVVGLNGIGAGTTISMGNTTIVPETNDSWWKPTDYIKTNSLVLDGKLSEDGKNINITILDSIPLEPSNPAPIEPPSKPPVEIDPPITPPTDPEPPVNPPINPEAPIVVDSLLYEKLNKVYQSIVTSGEIGSLANTTLLENKTYNESLGGLLTILDQMYANNPYAYTVKSSRDSLKIFEDNMSYLTIKPKKDEMIVQGKAIYTGVKNDNGAYGKNYYGFDTGHRNYKTTTNTVGGLATFEYGLSDKTSVGVVLGGNNQDINFKGSSKIKGNSLYLGTFAKTDINNFKFMGGVGYQYTSADVDRKVSNRYDSFSTGDKYDINSLNAFVEAKYIYNAEQDWTVEPKVRLSYYYIDQDKVNEGYIPGQISMKTDKINSNTADVEIGVDFVKSLYLNNGKLKNVLSLGVINTIGDKSKELNGYILGKEKDGKKFDIQGVELPKTSGKVSYNIELEQTNGMIYTAGVSLEFAKDYNRNVSATVGIGYKF